MADAMMVLRQEITTLERELAKRRTALAALNGSTTSRTRTPAARPGSRPRKPAGPPLGARLVAYLRAHKGKRFAPAQVAEALSKTDKSVTRANVQRRLGELFQRKQVKRVNGRYGVV